MALVASFILGIAVTVVVDLIRQYITHRFDRDRLRSDFLLDNIIALQDAMARYRTTLVTTYHHLDASGAHGPIDVTLFGDQLLAINDEVSKLSVRIQDRTLKHLAGDLVTNHQLLFDAVTGQKRDNFPSEEEFFAHLGNQLVLISTQVEYLIDQIYPDLLPTSTWLSVVSSKGVILVGERVFRFAWICIGVCVGAAIALATPLLLT